MAKPTGTMLRWLLAAALLLAPAGRGGVAVAQTINPDDVTHILPTWGHFAGATDADVQAEMAYMRAQIGEGTYVKLGFSMYIAISMEDWSVDPSNRTAIRDALAGTIAQIDARLAKARRNNVPISLMFLTAIRGHYDPVQQASENEDVRSMQWYADGVIAPGWWTHSRYARKARAVQEAYIRELGTIVADRLQTYSDVFVAATGDGEVELAFERNGNVYADYSPFTVAEFRDWIRHAGLYASGAAYEGQGYTGGARYANDRTPGEDTNGDGHTLNGDFGTAFTTWDLLRFNWSLDDPYHSGDPQAISLAAYSAGGVPPAEEPGGFDAPRTPRATGADAWWDLWVRFKETMIHHHNLDFARWMTRSADGRRTIAPSRWYSDQIPADYLFSTSPADPGDRLKSSASPHWTADIWPYGSLGITAFNVDPRPASAVAYTLRNVAPHVAARDRRWGIIEWHPGVLPDVGVSTDLELFRSEMTVIEQYRPSLLQPFTWDDPRSPTKGTAFEVALKELVERIKDGRPPDPRLELDVTGTGGRVTQPFELRGWAVDLGKIRGPGRGPGIDDVHVYAYRDPGSGTPPIFLGKATYGGARGDVAAVHGAQFAKSGFAITIGTLPAGRYQIVAFGHSTVSQSFNVSNSVTLDVQVTLIASPGSLNFAATKAGAAGEVVRSTPAQSTTLLYNGPGTPAWIATADQPWLQLTNASGTGPGQFAVAIVNPGNVIGGSASLTATITVTAPNVNATPTLVPVTLTIDQTGAGTTAPFGQVDSPVQNAAGVVGSIGITGWALDDLGITAVRLYRNCLPFEPANCQVIAGRTVVYMGDADIVPDARPDVEAAYRGYPQASRAGWGYLLLTNMLPHIPNELAYGGQGTLDISILAIDVEGHQKWLGRSVLDEAPTTITMTNDSAAKPFGAIDTPGQGEVVSGAFYNFGWALTPDSNTTNDAADIEIATNGATMWVWIDGAPVSTVTYNLCRGSASVGSPPGAGQFCDDDVSNIFGNPTPQALHSPRSSNPTLYRNLDSGRGPIGAYFLDTTTMTNGRHSIVWSVTDSAGRSDGIGSRDFIVLNGQSAAAGGSFEARRDAASLHALALDDATAVLGRTGWTMAAPLVGVPADAAGVRRVQVPALGRLELSIAGVEHGHLLANGTLRDLPAGSRLDTGTGIFTWALGTGHFGTYRLVFVRGGRQLPFAVSVLPARGAGEPGPAIRMHVDAPLTGSTSSGALTVVGWALDRQASLGSGIDAVHVWAQRRDIASAAQTFLGAAQLSIPRPDVAAVFGPQFGHTGFKLTAGGLAPGQYDVTAFVWNRRTGRWEDARTVSLAVR